MNRWLTAHNAKATGDRLLLWGAAALAVLLITLPLSHVMLVRNLAFWLAVLVALALYLLRKDDELPLVAAFLIWLVAASLSLFSLAEKGEAVELIWREVGKGALVFYAAYLLAKAGVSVVLWFRAAAVALGVLASLAILAWVKHGTWTAVGLVPALGDYNTSALTLFPLLALPWFSAWREACGRFSLPLSALVIGLGLVAGALSMSRGFWLICAILVLLTILPLRWRMKSDWKKAVLWTLATLILLAGIAWAVAAWRGIELLRFGERDRIYWPVLHHVFNAPWNGFGYGHEAQKAWYAKNIADAEIFHAHNLTLSYIEQMGLLGIAVLVALFGGLGRAFVRHFNAGDPRRASLAALGLALVAAIFVRNNLDIFFVRHNLLIFFLICGLMLGLLDAGKTKNA